MGITYLNGERLKRAFIAGSRKVFQRREYLNRINVFPVADSDTGTNMAETLNAVVARLLGLREPALYAVARIAADSALDGARGNSGTILAQFFYGLAEAVGTEIRLTTSRFAEAIRDAVDYAYQAIVSPQEGTILTVLKEWARSLHRSGAATTDFRALLEESLSPARRSLEGTQVTLSELAEAGVVDAGAQGFVDLLDGIVTFIGSGRIRELEGYEPLETSPEHVDAVEAAGDLSHRYCTECILEDGAKDQAALRAELARYGDSLIVAGSRKKTKIHIHTDRPAELFGFLTRNGKVVRQKIDDMRRQYHASHAPHRDCVLVVDSTCDLPAETLEELDIHVVSTHLLFDGAAYIDKLGISAARFFEMMNDRPEVVPSTSQPSPGDFLRTFTFLAQHYREIVYLGLSSALSGTLRSAETAAHSLGGQVSIIDTRQASIGTGLVARRVGEAIRDGADAANAIRLARSLLEGSRLFLTVPSLEGLIRSGRIGRRGGRLGDLLNLKPILSLSSAGRVVPVGAAVGGGASRDRILRHVERFLPQEATVDIAVAHAAAPEDARWLVDAARDRFKLEREPYVIELSPVLTAHTGVGAFGMACMVSKEER